MLLQFNFKNFKSFREEATLDLTAAKITEKPEHIVPLGQEKVLPVAAVFGANASGKSNVVEALRFMQTYVLESFGYGGETSDRAKKERARPAGRPLRLICPEKATPHSLRCTSSPPRRKAAKAFITDLL